MRLHDVALFFPSFPKLFEFKFQVELEFKYFKNIFDSRSSEKTLSNGKCFKKMGFI